MMLAMRLVINTIIASILVECVNQQANHIASDGMHILRRDDDGDA